MKTKINNPIARMFSAIAEVINSFLPDGAEQQERAVTISNIWSAVQNHLDETAQVDEFGEKRFNGHVLDVYLEDAGAFAILTRGDGKLYKIPVTVDAESQIAIGDEQTVVIDFKPVATRSITVKRQADGTMRWFAMPACTAVLNRVGEIDSRALFDTFVDHIERGGEYPELDFFHLGERMILGTADWVARDDFSYCASGLFEDSEIGRAAAKALEDDPDFWGLSIAYLPTEEPEMLRSADGIEIPVFNAGINRYISLLPENDAAAILTSISTGEEVNRMDKKVKEALRKLAGEDDALFEDMVAKVDDVNRSATGMINREQTPVAAKPALKPAAKAPAAAEPAPVARELTDADIDAVLASDKFAARFGEMFTSAMEARSSDEDEETETEDTEETETEDTEEEETTAEPTAESSESTRAILDEIKKVNARIDDLAKEREAEVQEVLNDLPARIAKTNIVRPRATRMPTDVNNRQARTNMAEVAAQTLASMGETA